MIRPSAIDHLVLRVRDAQAMAAFYIEVLGCSLERRRDDIGLVQLRAGESLIDLVSVDGTLGRQGGAAPGAEGRNLDHFCLRVSDADRANRGRRHCGHRAPDGHPGRRDRHDLRPGPRTGLRHEADARPRSCPCRRRPPDRSPEPRR